MTLLKRMQVFALCFKVDNVLKTPRVAGFFCMKKVFDAWMADFDNYLTLFL